MSNNVTMSFKTNEYMTKTLYRFITAYISKKLGTSRSRRPHFGNYFNASRLGWGYPHSHTFKSWLHRIFNNQYFYPKTILVNREYVRNNLGKVDDFIQNQRRVLKPDRGHSGLNIHIVESARECVENMNNRGHWVLQKEIKPMLFNGRKFDLRIFHFILRYENQWYNVLSRAGYVKVSHKEFDPHSKKSDGFITNITFNENRGEKVMYDFFDFIKMISNSPQQIKSIENSVYNVIRDYSALFAKQLQRENRKYLKNKSLKAQIMILGPDIMINSEGHAMLLETNCIPGIIRKGESAYPKQRRMIEELLNNIVIPLIQNKKVNFQNYNGRELWIERL